MSSSWQYKRSTSASDLAQLAPGRVVVDRLIGQRPEIRQQIVELLLGKVGEAVSRDHRHQAEIVPPTHRLAFRHELAKVLVRVGCQYREIRHREVDIGLPLEIEAVALVAGCLGQILAAKCEPGTTDARRRSLSK